MRHILLTLLLLNFSTAFAASAQAEQSDKINAPSFTRAGHTTDSLKQVRERVKSKQAVLVDVREENEWKAGHLAAAKLVPLSRVRNNTLTTTMKKALPKDKPIYLHCKSGGRVLMVSEILREKGYDIRPLRAGYEKLLDEGFKKATPSPKTR